MKVRATRELLFMVFDTLRYNCCGTTATTQRHAQTSRFAVVPYQFTYGYQTLAWRAKVRCGISSLASLSPVFLENYFYGGPSNANLTACVMLHSLFVSIRRMKKKQFDNGTTCGIIASPKSVGGFHLNFSINRPDIPRPSRSPAHLRPAVAP
jgi:hypothetical protein